MRSLPKSDENNKVIIYCLDLVNEDLISKEPEKSKQDFLVVAVEIIGSYTLI